MAPIGSTPGTAARPQITPPLVLEPRTGTLTPRSKGPAPVNDHTKGHYAQLASSYDAIWSNRAEYVTWMSTEIAKRLRISAGDRIADVGAGTGLFVRRLAQSASPDTPILCIDPSTEMLEHLPADPRLQPICGTAEDVAGGWVELPYEQFDAIVMK